MRWRRFARFSRRKASESVVLTSSPLPPSASSSVAVVVGSFVSNVVVDIFESNISDQYFLI